MKTAHFCFQKACLFDRQERICCCSVAACTPSAKESHSIRARFARRCSTEPYEHLLLSFRHIQNGHLSDTNGYQVTDALPPRRLFAQRCHPASVLSMTKLPQPQAMVYSYRCTSRRALLINEGSLHHHTGTALEFSAAHKRQTFACLFTITDTDGCHRN